MWFLRHSKLRLGFVALFAMLVLSACGQKDASINEFIDDTEPADRLYNEALANLSAGRSSAAIEKLDEVDRQHPYSEFGRRSNVLKTFVAYRSGKYDDAIAAGERYVQQYPSSEDAAYAQYLVGLSHWRQIPDVTRDQEESRRAIAAFSAVVERYPDSEYVDDSKKKILFARDQIAGKEMLVGRYYQERREHLAAITRFRNVVEALSNTRHVEEALARLAESYLALGLEAEAQTAGAILGHNFPESEWYADTYNLLQRGGLSPSENNKSWISRAFAGNKKA